jgi:hypothetical protein
MLVRDRIGWMISRFTGRALSVSHGLFRLMPGHAQSFAVAAGARDGSARLSPTQAQMSHRARRLPQ